MDGRQTDHAGNLTNPRDFGIMLAYPLGETQKSDIIAELQDHAHQDRLIKGVYWENGKGCAVGCTIKSEKHSEYEERFGIPMILAHLEDSIFEGLPNSQAMLWPMQFMSAIPVGSDLSLVGWKFLERMLRRIFSKFDGSNPIHNECAYALEIVSMKALGLIVSDSSAVCAMISSRRSWARRAADRDEGTSAAAAVAAACDAISLENSIGAATSSARAAHGSRDGIAERNKQVSDLLELLRNAPVPK
jgi:hypothetical protein